MISNETSPLQLQPKHLVHAQALSHTQVKHNLFTSTGDSVGANISVQPLDLAALPAAAVTKAAEDLAGFTGAELERGCRLRLEARDGTAEFEHRLRLVHALALVHDVLQPVVRGLDLARHVCQFHADDRVVDEALAERLTLVSVLHGFFVADTGEAHALDDNANSLVVEVGHYDCPGLVCRQNVMF